MKRELTIPPAAESDPKAIELLRVWAAHGEQHVSIATEIWTDPTIWGIMLVDLAKHIALTYQRSHGKDSESVLSAIMDGFDAEWERPTDEPKGS